MEKKVIELADLRREFSSHGLLESDVSPDPFKQFDVWMEVALDSAIIDANAMTLSTVGNDGKPSARVVLLKHFSEDGFCFYTNYESKKGRDLNDNPHAMLHFFWPQLDRQIAISGSVEKTSREESEKYFNSRPVDSRIGAWASAQSTVISSRHELEQKFEEFRAQFGENVPLPPHWGGFNLIPYKFEFWQGRQNRLHDRVVYDLQDGTWKISRLSP